MGLFFKILFFPFVFIWRLICDVFKFFMFVQTLITMVTLLAVGILVFYLFKGNPELFHRVLNAIHLPQ
jgi:hypothetical protein